MVLLQGTTIREIRNICIEAMELAILDAEPWGSEQSPVLLLLAQWPMSRFMTFHCIISSAFDVGLLAAMLPNITLLLA